MRRATFRLQRIPATPRILCFIPASTHIPSMARLLSSQNYIPRLHEMTTSERKTRDITEDQLFSYTRYRWLRDDTVQQHRRYRKFNLLALLDIAIAAVGEGAQQCTDVTKCVEGQYNKAFILRMDNGREVIAKLPNPNAGPEFFLTASEVATRTFLRDVLFIPIPRIISWSSTTQNSVGAEYIIEEKAHGIPLGELWSSWSFAYQSDMLEQIVKIQAKLASLSFSKQGCLYFKEDLSSRGLEFTKIETAPNAAQNVSLMDRYVLGPLTQPQLWNADRAQMHLDRGPWSDELAYIQSLAHNEIKWAKSYARARINCHRSLSDLETPAEYQKLLEKYLRLTPYLIQNSLDSIHVKTLSHSDLHLDNIFVDPKTKELTHIIDWQTTSVSSIYLQHQIPRMIETMRDTVTDSDSSTKTSNPLLSRYQELCEQQHFAEWQVHTNQNRALLIKPIDLITGAWDREDVFSFRHSLISIAAHWPRIYPGITCPIHFENDELNLHDKERELLEGLGTIIHLLNEQGLIPVGGMVPREKFEAAQAINEYFKNCFIELGENEAQKELHAKVWPYQNK